MAIYTWVTPDYLLSAWLSLAVPGGEEVPVVLLPDGGNFAPLYLWSRPSTALSNASRRSPRTAAQPPAATRGREDR